MGYPAQPQGYEYPPSEPGSYPQYPTQFGQTYEPAYYDPAAARGYPPYYGEQPPPPPQRSRKGLYAGLAITSIVVVTLLITAAIGVLPIPGLSPSSGGSPSASPATPLTLFQAENIANSTVAQQDPGWQLSLALGLQTPNGFNPMLDYPCSTYGFSPPSTTIVGTGEAYAWGFEYMSSSSSAAFMGTGPIPHGIFIVVSNGTATITTRANDWQACPGVEYGNTNVLPSNFAGSTSVSAAAQSAGGSAFLEANPGSSSVLFLEDEFINATTFDPTWTVQYSSSCSTTDATLSQESIVLNATTLAIVSPASTSTASCTPGPPAKYTVSFAHSGSSTSKSGNLYYDNLSVSSNPVNLDLQYFGIALFEPNRSLIYPGEYPPGCQVGDSGCGGVPSLGEWYATLEIGTQVVAVFPSGSDATWLFDTTTALSGAMTLTLISTIPLSGSGYTLQAFSWEEGNVGGSTTL